MPLSNYLHCQGTPNGECPDERNDETVHLCQGDYHLCHSCEGVRFPRGDPTLVNRVNVFDDRNNETNNANSDEIIIQPLLSYILFSLGSGTVTNIIRAVANHFVLDVIEEAKNVLWAKCDHSVIGAKSNRRDSAVRSVKEAHIQDIITALQKLDAQDNLPRLAIDAQSLGIIPRSHPEELNDISVMDRLNKMEQKFSALQEALDSIYAENIVIKEQLLQQNTKQKSWSDIVKPVQRKPTVSDIQASNSNNQFSAGTTKKNPSNQYRKPNLLGIPPNVLQRANSMNSINSDKTTASDNSGFVFQSHQAKKIRQHQSRKKKIVTGNTTHAQIKGAPEPVRDMFIYRVHQDTESDILCKHIEDNGFNVLDLTCISKPEAKFKSFKLSVPVSQFTKLFDESLWPVGIRVRRYYAPRPLAKIQ